MVYSTYTDVRRIIDTGLEDADITALIVQADAEMLEREMSFTTTNMKTISALITASLIALKDPESRGVGDYSEKVRSPQEWRDAAEGLAERLIKIGAEPKWRRG
jgi:hypothetical protein